MSLDPVEVAILRLAVDDYFGLWEVAEEIHGGGSIDAADKLKGAQAVIHRMIEKGLISVAVRDGPVGNPVVVGAPLSDVLIDDEGSWVLPSEAGTQTLIFATPAGERSYYAHPAVTTSPERGS